jgi:calcineurin-like phosphoesterase family protein
MKWVTADHHFGHTNIIAYEGRPFADAGEMDAAMVERWNRVVRPGDTVYHLGDFALASKDRTSELVSALDGRKVLVRGNHDGSTRHMLECGFDEVHDAPIVVYDDATEVRLLLTHRPVLAIRTVNVAVENWDYYPIPLPTPRGWTQLCGHVHRRWIATIGGF